MKDINFFKPYLGKNKEKINSQKIYIWGNGNSWTFNNCKFWC